MKNNKYFTFAVSLIVGMLLLAGIFVLSTISAHAGIIQTQDGDYIMLPDGTLEEATCTRWWTDPPLELCESTHMYCRLLGDEEDCFWRAIKNGI